MKSKLADRSLQTSCKECVFAIYDNNTQTGCGANRIEKFKDKVIEAYDNDKEFYVIDTFCNYYRQSTWNSGVASINKVKYESGLTFDVLIDCNDMDDKYADNILSFINNIDYCPSKLSITLFHTYNQPKDTYKKVSKIYAEKNKKIEIATCFDKDLYLHELMIKSRKIYHTVIHHKMADASIFTRLNNEVNDNLVKFITAYQHGVYVYSNIAYKIEFATKEKDSYFTNILSVLEISKNSGMYIEL